jgi:hypothetical protein
MAFQMRFTAVARSLNFLTRDAPGKLFQISMRRAGGQIAASLASAGSLANMLRIRDGFGLFAAGVKGNVVGFGFNRKGLHLDFPARSLTARSHPSLP